MHKSNSEPGWPNRQRDEFRAEWRHDKHCDLLRPLTVRSVFLWKQWSQSTTSVCKESKPSLRGLGYFEETPVHRPNSPGMSSAHGESTVALGGRLFAILLSLQWAEAFKEEGLELFHSDCNIPPDCSLLCYFLVPSLPTFPLSFGLFIACPEVSQGGFHSYEWGWEDSWNRVASSSDYRKLLIVSDRHTLQLSPLSLSFLQETVCKYFVICSHSLSFCYSHVQQIHLTLQKMPGGDSRERWGTEAGKRLTDTLYKLIQATWLCKSHMPGPVLSILNVLSYFNSPSSPQWQGEFLCHFKDGQTIRGEENWSWPRSHSYNQHTFTFSK